jgi:hypothetical protein
LFAGLAPDVDGDPAGITAVGADADVALAGRLVVDRAAVEAADEISVVVFLNLFHI